MNGVVPVLERGSVTSPSSVLEAAAALVSQILQALNIGRVVNVDDDFAVPQTPSLNSILLALKSRELPGSLVATKLAPYSGAFLDDEEIDKIARDLEQYWSVLSGEDQTELTQAADRSTASVQSVDEQAAVQADVVSILSLSDLVGDSATFVPMSAKTWRESGLEMLSDGTRTLVLFDRDLRREQLGERAGEDLLRGLLTIPNLPHVITGMLTHTATTLEQELAIAQEIVKETGELGDDHRVVVIAKSRLQVEGHSFPEALRLVLMSSELEEYRAHAVASISAALQEAITDFESANRYTIMANMESARRDGMFELDGPIRLVDRTIRRSLASNIRDENLVTELLPKLRNAAAVELYFGGSEKPDEFARREWDDLFDNHQYLADLHLPLDIGDVFKIVDPNAGASSTAKPSFYVVLAQACDLSVRERGVRMNGLDNIVLTQIKELTWDEKKNERRKPTPTQEVIGVFKLDTGVAWVVDFSIRLTVPAHVLDLAIANPNGAARFDRTVVVPTVVALPWEIRLTEVLKQHKEWVEKAKELYSDMKDSPQQIRDLMLKHHLAAVTSTRLKPKEGVTAKLDRRAGSIDYGVSRVARVVGSRATALLGLAAHHQSRPAYDPPFGPHNPES